MDEKKLSKNDLLNIIIKNFSYWLKNICNKKYNNKDFLNKITKTLKNNKSKDLKKGFILGIISQSIFEHNEKFIPNTDKKGYQWWYGIADDLSEIIMKYIEKYDKHYIVEKQIPYKEISKNIEDLKYAFNLLKKIKYTK